MTCLFRPFTKSKIQQTVTINGETRSTFNVPLFLFLTKKYFRFTYHANFVHGLLYTLQEEGQDERVLLRDWREKLSADFGAEFPCVTADVRNLAGKGRKKGETANEFPVPSEDVSEKLNSFFLEKATAA